MVFTSDNPTTCPTYCKELTYHYSFQYGTSTGLVVQFLVRVLIIHFGIATKTVPYCTARYGTRARFKYP